MPGDISNAPALGSYTSAYRYRLLRWLAIILASAVLGYTIMSQPSAQHSSAQNTLDEVVSVSILPQRYVRLHVARAEHNFELKPMVDVGKKMFRLV